MQNHLEGFFAHVRAKLECNTNPTYSYSVYSCLQAASSRWKCRKNLNIAAAANILAQDNTECLDIFTMVKNSMDYMHTQYDLDKDVELMDEFESLDPVLN